MFIFFPHFYGLLRVTSNQPRPVIWSYDIPKCQLYCPEFLMTIFPFLYELEITWSIKLMYSMTESHTYQVVQLFEFTGNCVRFSSSRTTKFYYHLLIEKWMYFSHPKVQRCQKLVMNFKWIAVILDENFWCLKMHTLKWNKYIIHQNIPPVAITPSSFTGMAFMIVFLLGAAHQVRNNHHQNISLNGFLKKV